jgi:hypothetical protein
MPHVSTRAEQIIIHARTFKSIHVHRSEKARNDEVKIEERDAGWFAPRAAEKARPCGTATSLEKLAEGGWSNKPYQEKMGLPF